MRKSLAILVCGVVLFVGVMALLTPADAGRRGGARGHHHAAAHRGGHRHHAAHRGVNRSYAASRNFNRNVNVNRNVNRRYVYRNGVRGYWRNGRWIAAPLVAGTGVGVAGAGYVATCAYEYNRWQATGSTYWRGRYNQCAGAAN